MTIAKIKNFGIALLLVVASVCLATLAAEGILRLKNASMQNYDIEMWRYAKELKIPSSNPVLGHEHAPSQLAVLQNVPIRVNAWGLRGGEIGTRAPNERRILFLGGSITLGWGVPEGDTVSARLQAMLREDGENVRVVNGGVGNYNAVRYVEFFLTRLKGIDPTDIVVQYFLRDAEILQAGETHFLLRHSQLASTIWILVNRAFGAGSANIVDYYRSIHRPEYPGRQQMEKALARLSRYARENHVRLYLAVIPDLHDLGNYQLRPIHELLKRIAKQLGYQFVDLLPAFEGMAAEGLWVMPTDPHPNARGHRLMAEALYRIVKRRP